ncbi:methyl-accepting chemotaxis protein [Sphingomonas sp. NCPPB 2930]
MKSLKAMLLALIASGILAAGVLTATSVVESSIANRSVQRALVAKDITADILPPPLYLLELRLVLSQAVEGSVPLARAQAEVARLQNEYQERIAFWKSHPTYGLETQLLGVQHAAAQRFMATVPAVFAALSAGDAAGARAALASAQALYLEHRQGVDGTVKAATAFADDSLASLATVQTDGNAIQIAVFCLAGVLLSGLGWWVRRSVWAATGGEPAAAAAVANAVAQGDLSVQVTVAPGDRSSVMAALEQMRANLADTVQRVRASSDSIATGSTQIAQGNHDLSGRTETQASALQQTAASMEEMASTVVQNAENARQAHRLAQGASDVATRGGSVVAEVVQTMKGINESSRRIADIIGLIDGIAFQTNILALNAAVEAARAGEQGRGFAVVASEVRNLAQRSAGAAREIRGLIDTSVQRADQGAVLVDHAGATMVEVVDAIRQVSGVVAQISAASAEQSSGVAQIGDAVNQLDQTTQQNAALVEESAAAAGSLRLQAEELVRAVSVFRLDTSAHQVPIAATAVGVPRKAAIDWTAS